MTDMNSAWQMFLYGVGQVVMGGAFWLAALCGIVTAFAGMSRVQPE